MRKDSWLSGKLLFSLSLLIRADLAPSFRSTSGFVNVYGSDSFSVLNAERTFSTTTTDNPKLVKALGHLTTPISTLRFNHDAQLLAMASKDKKDSMRLVSCLLLSSTCISYFLLTALPFTGASAISNSFRELAHIKYATGTRNSCRFLGTQRVYCYWKHSREGTPLSSQGLRRWRGVFAQRPLM